MTDTSFRFPHARIAVFAKAPVPGRVKTRLARALGAPAAARAYRTMLAERIASLAAAGLAPLELWVAPHAHPYLRGLARRYGASVRVQPNGDLGSRMRAALSGSRPTVVIGGDCMGTATSSVEQALAALAAGTAVTLAPAEDGGYTLLGTRQPPHGILRHMPWGSDRVLVVTRERLARAGIEALELPVSWDVDDGRDWHRWRRSRKRIGSLGCGPYC